MKSEISIITPVYNCRRTLKRCIRSMQRQSMPAYEWIIVDDSSTDDSARLLKELAAHDSRVILVTNTNNLGAVRSRYTAIQCCTAPYITFLDADDAFLPDALESITAAIKHAPHDIYISDSFLYVPKLRYKRPFYTAADSPAFSSSDVCSGEQACIQMLENDGITPNLWDKTYSRALVEQFLGSPVNLTIGEDLAVNLRLLSNAHSVKAISSRTYLWSYNGLGKKYYLERWADSVRMFDFMLEELPAIIKSTGIRGGQIRPAAASYYMRCVRESCVQRILRHDSEAEIKSFLQQSLSHNILRHIMVSGKWAESGTPDAEAVLLAAKEHLHSHKNYYTFTRALNIFL